ncbi:MAG: ATP cone domain-containing protein [Candidatus Micrarchaeaceae archaeon]
MKVRRRNGMEEEFVREKIVVSVVKAGGKVELGRAIAEEIEQELAASESATTDEIRSRVLAKLKDRDLDTYNSWIEYDTKEGKIR